MAGRKTGHFFMEIRRKALELSVFSYNRVAVARRRNILPRSLKIRVVSYH
jgi:hypothetical protein